MKTIKRYLTLVLPVLMAAVMMTACSSSKNSEGAFIPKDAYFVADINVGSMWQKGELANADQLNSVQLLRTFLQGAAPEIDNLFGEIIKDPSSCGIDMERNIDFFMSKGEDGKDMGALVAALKDQKTFENFIATLTKDNNIKSEKDGGRQILLLDKDCIAVYDENTLVFVIDVDYVNNTDALKAYAAKIFDLDEDNSMLADENFTKYQDLRQDINFFANYESILKLSGGAQSAAMMQYVFPKEDAEALMKSAIYYTISFENGAIDIKQGNIGAPENLKKLINQKFNDKLVNYMPEQTLAAITFGINTKELFNYFSKVPTLKELTKEDTDFGTVEEIVNAFGGSFVASFYGATGDTPLFAVACDITNHDLVAAMLDNMGIANGIPDSPVKVYLGSDVLVISSDANVISAAQKGGFGNGMSAIADNAKKGNYMYIDLKYQDYPESMLNSLGIQPDAVSAMILAMLDYAEYYTVDNNEGHLKLHLTNTTANSLAYAIQTIDQLAANSL